MSIDDYSYPLGTDNVLLFDVSDFGLPELVDRLYLDVDFGEVPESGVELSMESHRFAMKLHDALLGCPQIRQFTGLN